jgi:hemerythrin-like domain-containing protein
MLRDQSLIPLSRQHQHALALCVRIRRALKKQDAEIATWQEEIVQAFEQEISVHFQAEEKILFPLAANFDATRALVEELLREHVALRGIFERAAGRMLSRDGLLQFAELLSSHVRKEERQLFEELQRLLPSERLAALGADLEQALTGAAPGCTLRPRPE